MNKNVKEVISKQNLICYAIILVLVFFDLLTKSIVNANLQMGESTTILQNILNFTNVHNKGGAYGIFSQDNATFVLGLFSLIFVVVFLFVNSFVVKDKDKFYFIGFVLITAGTIGNMIDRFSLGFVRDFIQVKFINFPVFNLADIFLVVGVILLCSWFIIKMVKENRESSLNK